jgi:hypothetical protein
VVTRFSAGIRDQRRALWSHPTFANEVSHFAGPLKFPRGRKFGPEGDLYVSNWGFGPPGLGEIVRVKVADDGD